MLSSREVYQCAKLLIDQHGGDGASDHCEKRIMQLTNERDKKGAAVWMGISEAVMHLREDTGKVDGLVH